MLWKGFILAFAAAILQSATETTRKYASSFVPFTSLVYFVAMLDALISVVAVGSLGAFSDVKIYHPRPFFIVVLGSSILLLSAKFLYQKALAASPLSLTVPYLSFSPAMLLLSAYFFLGERPSHSGVAGVCIITLAGFLLSRRSALAKNHDVDPALANSHNNSNSNSNSNSNGVTNISRVHNIISFNTSKISVQSHSSGISNNNSSSNSSSSNSDGDDAICLNATFSNNIGGAISSTGGATSILGKRIVPGLWPSSGLSTSSGGAASLLTGFRLGPRSSAFARLFTAAAAMVRVAALKCRFPGKLRAAVVFRLRGLLSRQALGSSRSFFRFSNLFRKIQALGVRCESGTILTVIVAFIWSITASLDKLGIIYAPSLWLYFLAQRLTIGVVSFVMMVRSGGNSFREAFSHLHVLVVISLLELATVVFFLLAVDHVLVSYVVAIKRTNILISVLAGSLLFRENILSRLPYVLMMLIGMSLIVVEPDTQLMRHEILRYGRALASRVGLAAIGGAADGSGSIATADSNVAGLARKIKGF